MDLNSFTKRTLHFVNSLKKILTNFTNLIQFYTYELVCERIDILN